MTMTLRIKNGSALYAAKIIRVTKETDADAAHEEMLGEIAPSAEMEVSTWAGTHLVIEEKPVT